MANMTASTITAYNTATAVTLYAAQDSHEILMDEKSDEKCLIIVQNTNTNASAAATITVTPSDEYLQGAGTFSTTLAGGSAVTVIGPLEGAKYKNSASKLAMATTTTAGGTVSYVKYAVVHAR